MRIQKHCTWAILADKPQGFTSQHVVNRLKHALGFKKAGHTGTLDPMATGLMIVFFEQATSLSHYLLGLDKEYLFTVKFGSQTDTADAQGTVVATKPIPTTLNIQDIRRVCKNWLGDIQQIPPMYSALKHEGKPLYYWARKNIHIERFPRTIRVKKLACIAYKEDQATFAVTGSKGLYVRTLAEDLANSLGTLGHVTQLRRYKIGDFRVSKACALSEEQMQKGALIDAKQHLVPADQLLFNQPVLQLDLSLVRRLLMGQRVFFQYPACFEHYCNKIIRYYWRSTWMGLAYLDSDGILHPKKNICSIYK